MIDLISIVAAFFTVKDVVNENKTAPKERRFDWDAYWKDIENGIDSMEQIEKRKNGQYYTTAREREQTVYIDKVVDVKRYQYDKKTYGEAITEINRQCGLYTYIKKF